MKCPLCKKGKLALCQDAIIVFRLKKLDDGTFEEKEDRKQTNYLDNTWLECSKCHKTSDDDKALKEMYDEMEFA